MRGGGHSEALCAGACGAARRGCVFGAACTSTQVTQHARVHKWRCKQSTRMGLWPPRTPKPIHRCTPTSTSKPLQIPAPTGPSAYISQLTHQEIPRLHIPAHPPTQLLPTHLQIPAHPPRDSPLARSRSLTCTTPGHPPTQSPPTTNLHAMTGPQKSSARNLPSCTSNSACCCPRLSRTPHPWMRPARHSPR